MISTTFSPHLHALPLTQYSTLNMLPEERRLRASLMGKPSLSCITAGIIEVAVYGCATIASPGADIIQKKSFPNPFYSREDKKKRLLQYRELYKQSAQACRPMVGSRKSTLLLLIMSFPFFWIVPD